MNSVAISGSDTLVLNERLITDLVDGDCGVLTFPGNLMTAKVGKNGNTIYSFSSDGERAELSLRVVRGSADDKYFNNALTQMKANPAGFILVSGAFTKKIGDGTGKVTSDTYVLAGGAYSKNVDGKTNSEGDVDSSVAVYQLVFSKAPRSIG